MEPPDDDQADAVRRDMSRLEQLRSWSTPMPSKLPENVQDECDGEAAAKLAAYERLAVLGIGGAAVVYLVRERTSQQLYAMKVQSCPMQQPWPRRTFHARKEQYILQMLRHPFVCRLHEAFHDSQRLYLVLEYHQGGNLADVQAFCGGTLSEQAVQQYASEIVQALEYVHTMGFVYRDLKPQNVLVASDGHIRLTDFGVAHEGLPVDPSRYYTLENSSKWIGDLREKVATTATATTVSTSEEEPGQIEEDDLGTPQTGHMNPDDQDVWETDSSSGVAGPSSHLLGIDDRVRVRSNSFVGTIEYMPPEMIQQAWTQSSDVDWWGLGCLLYELLYGVSPFKKPNENSTKPLFCRILLGKLAFPASPRVSGPCKDLIRRLLSVDTRKRLGHRHGSTEVKAHEFFRGVTWAFHSREPPVRVQTRCVECLRHEVHQDGVVVPPFLSENNYNEDDADWCRWHERVECESQLCQQDCSHGVGRYEKVLPTPSRFQTFVRYQSERLAAFRAGDKPVTAA
jgi:serine/threonine protein kinase